MAYRAFYSKYLQNFNLLSSIPRAAPKQPTMLLGTFQKPAETAAKTKPFNIKKYYELIPLFLIVGGGITGLTCYVIRVALTRDDVRYKKSSKFPYEAFDMEKDKPPKARKFLVFNQKYETPTGLVEAMEAIKEDGK